jgi:hypothetical protein
VHLTVELFSNEDGQLEGTVELETKASVAFSGTLELLKVLQDATQGSGGAEQVVSS